MVENLASGADKAVEAYGLVLRSAAVWEDVDENNEAEGEDDILYGARAGAECVVIARGHEGPGVEKAGVKAYRCKGADRA